MPALIDAASLMISFQCSRMTSMRIGRPNRLSIPLYAAGFSTAPLGWQHINLTGDYIWTEPSRLDGKGFRPLAAPSGSTHTDVLDLSA